MLEAGYGMWDVGFGMWDVGCGMWDVGCGMWDVGCGMWDVGYGMWDVGRSSCIRISYSLRVFRVTVAGLVSEMFLKRFRMRISTSTLHSSCAKLRSEVRHVRWHSVTKSNDPLYCWTLAHLQACLIFQSSSEDFRQDGAVLVGCHRSSTWLQSLPVDEQSPFVVLSSHKKPALRARIALSE
jgi:hypothetical protein